MIFLRKAIQIILYINKKDFAFYIIMWNVKLETIKVDI